MPARVSYNYEFIQTNIGYFKKNIITWKQLNESLIVLYYSGIITEKEADKVGDKDPGSFASLLGDFLEQKVSEYKNNEHVLLKFAVCLFKVMYRILDDAFQDDGYFMD